MKLTQKELIRLKKETHLLEHGFYERDIHVWYLDNIEKADKDKRGEILRRHPNLNPYAWKELRQIWFRETFPEFFDREKRGEHIE